MLAIKSFKFTIKSKFIAIHCKWRHQRIVVDIFSQWYEVPLFSVFFSSSFHLVFRRNWIAWDYNSDMRYKQSAIHPSHLPAHLYRQMQFLNERVRQSSIVVHHNKLNIMKINNNSSIKIHMVNKPTDLQADKPRTTKWIGQIFVVDYHYDCSLDAGALMSKCREEESVLKWYVHVLPVRAFYTNGCVRNSFP